MKVTIINCFDTYEERVNLVYEYFKQLDYDVNIITSNFMHFKKKFRTSGKKKLHLIQTQPYYKNLSIKRLKSHYYFSKKAVEKLEELRPDVIYVMIPPNSLTKFVSQYKKIHKEVKVIYDIIDLWPETMPISKLEKTPPLLYWKKLRNSNLKFSNIVITECNLYQTILAPILNDIPTETVYLAKKDIKVVKNNKFINDELHLCYIGSINNIIDIKKIKDIISAIEKHKHVVVHIIGDGESREELLNEIRNTGASIKFYGKIYDAQKKQNIIDNCHFGINIMKSTVCVGLTMKSIDYFQHGLPIINNIPADTATLIQKKNAGYNVTDDNVNDIAKTLSQLTSVDYKILKNNTEDLFEDYFSQKEFNNKLDSIFTKTGIVVKVVD